LVTLRSMISSLGLGISRAFRRIVPDPYVIAVLLSLVVALLALTLGTFPKLAATDLTPSLLDKCSALLGAWGSSDGLWRFLAFSMQMCLVMVTGHALAESKPIRRILARVSSLPRTASTGVATVAAVTCATSILNWGLGLIVGAIVARDIARSLHHRRVPAHYPLLVAAGFTGMMIWHGGLSGSAPLTMTTADNALKVVGKDTLARLGEVGYSSGIPLDKTTFSSMNAIVTLGLLVLIPLVMALLAPKSDRDIQTIAELAPKALTDETDPDFAAQTRESPGQSRLEGWIPDALERSRLICWLLALPLIGVFARFVLTSDPRTLGLNEIACLMMGAGLILHGSLRSYAKAAEGAGAGCVGVVLQFPLYGGVVAMLITSGLDRVIAERIAAGASHTTLPVFTFFAAGVLNTFIPSGGAQWGVQGPIAIESALKLGVDPARMVLAVAYGDQITNMLQPFWALPLLAITGAKARDIVGYCAVVMLAGGIFVIGCLLLL